MRYFIIVGLILIIILGFNFTKLGKRAKVWLKPNFVTNSIKSRKSQDEIPLKTLIDSAQKVSLNKKLGLKKLSVRVSKKQYQLDVLYGNDVLKSYPIVLGFEPEADKMQEGDGCTPEGTFHIKAKYPHASWSKFMWIDYPNSSSWEKFKKNKASKAITSNATIGGEIGIHGTPKDRDYVVEKGINWTLGCICLKNHHINELYNNLKVGTQIVIKK